jgi:ankyrin repeat protein
MNIYDLISKDDPNGLLKSLKKGNDPNQLDEYGQTPIFRVVYNKTDNQKTLLQILIDNGANVNFRKSDGATPLFHAKKEIADILISNGANPNLTSNDGSTILHSALDKNTVEFLLGVGLPINAKNDSLEIPLHSYVYFGSDLVELAIDNGADVNQRNKWGHTPLINLAMTEVLVKDEDIVDSIKTAQLLIKAGADNSIRDNDNKTAYDYAIENKNLELADYLKSLD